MRAPASSHGRLVSAMLALLLVTIVTACGASGGSDDAAPSTTKASSATDGPDATDSPDTTETEKPTTTKGGGGAASGSEQDYIDALVSSYDEETDGDEFTRDQVECLATGWVVSLGAKTFEKAGVSPADLESSDQNFDDLDLTEAQANAMVDVYGTCGIDVQAMMLKGFSSDSTTAAQTACLEKALTDDVVHDFLVSSIVGESPEDSPVMEAMTACMSN